MACLEGFKPPTFWVETKDSVQLSYRHMKDVQINEHQGRNSIRSFPKPKIEMVPEIGLAPIRHQNMSADFKQSILF